jgi:hypothetical protein
MGLRDRVGNRERPTRAFFLRIDDDSVPREALTAATTDEERDQAQADINACYEKLTVRTISVRRWEELIEAHPPGEDEDADSQWGPTFIPALLAESIEGDITEADWQDYIDAGVLTSGEIAELANITVELNHRVFDPKG